MTQKYQKFDQKPIARDKFDRIFKLMDFSGIGGEYCGVYVLPFLKRAPSCKFIWGLPSTGCDYTDQYIGCECALALLCSITVVVEGDVPYGPDPVPSDLFSIYEGLYATLSIPSLEDYALGFWTTIQGFIDLALNSPRLHAETLDRLRELAHSPHLIRERFGLVLAGYSPPEILSSLSL